MEDSINERLQEAADWMERNHLTLNKGKTKFICFGTQPITSKMKGLHIEHGGTQIEPVDEYKYLGIILDITLKFDCHVKYIRKKCIGRLKMLG